MTAPYRSAPRQPLPCPRCKKKQLLEKLGSLERRVADLEAALAAKRSTDG